MKRKISLFLVVFSVILIVSCSPNLRSPIELIKKPKANTNNKLMNQTIFSKLPNGAVRIRPIKPGVLSSSSEIDLDSDGQSEVYSFYRVKNTNTVGVLIMKKDEENWSLFSNIEHPGSDINYAKFVDLNNDGILDIVLSVEVGNKSFNAIHVYISSEDKSYRYALTDRSTEVFAEDFNNDGNIEILNIFFNKNTNAYASMYSLADSELKVISEINFDESVESYEKIFFGNISDEKKAVVIDISLGNKMASNVIVFENGKLLQLFEKKDEKYDYSSTLRDKLLLSSDVDEDGIIEIPRNYSSDEDLDTSKLNDWLELETIEKGIFKFKTDIVSYTNKYAEYEFFLPKKWFKGIKENKLSFEFSSAPEKKDYFAINFLARDGKKYRLFTTESFSQKGYYKWRGNEDFDKEVIEIALVGQSYLVSHYEKSSTVPRSIKYVFNTMKVDIDTIKNNFKLLK